MKNIPLNSLGLKVVLSDTRFIKIIEVLTVNDKILAIYLVRLITGFSLVPSKRYVENLSKFKKYSDFRQRLLRKFYR